MTHFVESVFQFYIIQDTSWAPLLEYYHNLRYILDYFSSEGQFNF